MTIAYSLPAGNISRVQAVGGCAIKGDSAGHGTQKAAFGRKAEKVGTDDA